MTDAVGLWVIVYFCVTSVNTKDVCIKLKVLMIYAEKYIQSSYNEKYITI